MAEMKKNFKNVYSVPYMLALTLTVYKEYLNTLDTQVPSWVTYVQKKKEK